MLRFLQRAIAGTSRPAGWRFVITLALLHLFLLAVLGVHYEPWRDEAESWLFARDLNLGELRRYTSNAGTPALWYFLLMPLAKGGLPYGALFVFHGLLATAAVVVFARWAPFSRPLKVLFAFSAFMSFEYAVVARPYVLVVLLSFVLAAIHRQRADRPLAYGLILGLLANASPFGTAIGGAIWIAWARAGVSERPRRPRSFVGLALAAAFGLVALWQLWPEPGGQLEQFEPGVNPLVLMLSLGAAFLPGVEWYPGALAGAAAALLAVVLLCKGTRDCPDALLPLLFGLVGVCAILSTGVFVVIRHQGMLLVPVIYALWIAGSRGERKELKSARAVWLLGLLLTFPVTIATWRGSLHHATSGGSEMAHYLEDNGLAEATIAAHTPGVVISVLAELDRETFYYPAYGREGSHMWWDTDYYWGELQPAARVLDRTEGHFGAQPFLLLLTKPLEENDEYELLYDCKRQAYLHPEERFYLYRRKPGSR